RCYIFLQKYPEPIYLILDISGEKYNISLPKGTIRSVLKMANTEVSQPIIFSIDNYFFGTREYNEKTENEMYKTRRGVLTKSLPRGKKESMAMSIFSPFPYLKKDFLLLLMNYDIFSHCLICESLKDGLNIHPFYQEGLESPRERTKSYLNPTYLNKQSSLDYWRLIEKYTYPPTCIGSVHFLVDSSSYGLPVNLKVKTSRFFIAQDWEKEISVLKAEEKRIAESPYLSLGTHIEENWVRYRANFPQIDSLSSIVEAYSILLLLKRNNLKLFQKLFIDATESKTSISTLARNRNVSPILKEQEWLDYVGLLVGSNIDDINEARRKLSLLVAEYSLKNSIRFTKLTEKELSEAASTDSYFYLRFLLFHTIFIEKQVPFNRLDDFFEKVNILQNNSEKFILWAMGITWFEKRSNLFLETPEPNWFRRRMKTHKEDFITNFSAYLNTCSSNHKLKNSKLEEIVRLIYESGVMKIAQTVRENENGQKKEINPAYIQLIQEISKIHCLAVKATNTRNSELVHFHYRFILTIQNTIPDDDRIEAGKLEEISELLSED
ncbi:MAG: hypothetical protein AAFR61_30410, partial [Bacteroidota bacterium]